MCVCNTITNVAGEKTDFAALVVFMRMQLALVLQLYPAEQQQGENQQQVKGASQHWLML